MAQTMSCDQVPDKNDPARQVLHLRARLAGNRPQTLLPQIEAALQLLDKKGSQQDFPPPRHDAPIRPAGRAETDQRIRPPHRNSALEKEVTSRKRRDNKDGCFVKTGTHEPAQVVLARPKVLFGLVRMADEKTCLRGDAVAATRGYECKSMVIVKSLPDCFHHALAAGFRAYGDVAASSARKQCDITDGHGLRLGPTHDVETHARIVSGTKAETVPIGDVA